MAALRIIASTEKLSHIALSGRLDIQGVQEVELKLNFQTAARRHPSLIDLSEVNFIGSVGMGMLMSIARALHLNSAGMVLLSPQEKVAQVLRGSSIDQIIPIASNLDDALRLLGLGA